MQMDTAGLSAIALYGLGESVASDSAPNQSPGINRARICFRSRDCLHSFTRPDWRIYSPVGGSSWLKNVSPARHEMSDAASANACLLLGVSFRIHDKLLKVSTRIATLILTAYFNLSIN